jgi:hypothetical protein
MALLIDPPFALGQTLGVTSTSEGTGWVGAVKQFTDVVPSTGARRTNRVKTCIAVRNVSGIALLPKRLVRYKQGTISEVDGYVKNTNEVAVGVVDEHLPAAGVANNDVFWLTINGPTEVKLGPGLEAAAGTVLVTGPTTAASTSAETAGQAQTFAANSLHPAHYVGTALSSGTTAQNVLAVVDLRRS